MLTFNEASFTSLCHKARAKAHGTDEHSLGWELLVLVREALELEPNGLLPGRSVLWHIEDLVSKYMNPPFRIRQTIDRELFQLRASEVLAAFHVHGKFSPVSKMFEFTMSGRDQSNSLIEIVIAVPDEFIAEIDQLPAEGLQGKHKDWLIINLVTPDRLRDEDRKWLRIKSPNDWVIHQGELKIRFGLESADWLPDEPIEFAITAHWLTAGGLIKIVLSDERATPVRHIGL